MLSREFRDSPWVSPARAIRELKPVLGLDKANQEIGKLLLSGNPALIARIGSTELRATLRQRSRDSSLVEKVLFLANGYGLPFWLENQELKLQKKSGFFPVTRKNVELFSRIYRSAISDINFLGSWIRGENAFESLMSCPSVTSLGNLEPLLSRNPWTSALEGKKVLVVHPFQESIESQFKKREEIFFKDRLILPEFELRTLPAAQTLGGETSDFDSWFDAFEHMKTEISQIDFEIAIVGAGAYGLPLSAAIKAQGKAAIHLGGFTQVLFGILGRRWERRPDFLASTRGNWVKPLASERPREIKYADGGAYW